MENNVHNRERRQWLARVTQRVSRVLMRRGQLADQAVEDLVQEAVVRWLAVIGEGSVEPTPQNEAILHAVARRVWLEAVAQAQRRARLLRGYASLKDSATRLECAAPRKETTAMGVVSAIELQQQVKQLLARSLAPWQVDVFILVWLDGCGWGEAAIRCGRRASSGDTARRRFRRFLSEHAGRRSLLSMLERFGIAPNPPIPQSPNPPIPQSLVQPSNPRLSTPAASHDPPETAVPRLFPCVPRVGRAAPHCANRPLLLHLAC